MLRQSNKRLPPEFVILAYAIILLTEANQMPLLRVLLLKAPAHVRTQIFGAVFGH